MGSLYGDGGGIRDWYLGNLEEYVISTATRDAGSLRQNLATWEQSGLPSDPAESERSAEYAALQEEAYAVLSEPIAKAREYMKQALDAEAEGTDAREWADKVVETLREPLEKVREMYASFTFEDDPGGSGGENPEGSPLGAALDLEGAREELETFRKEAAEPVALTAGASGITSAARTAYKSVKNLFSTPIPIRAVAQTEGGDNNGQEAGNGDGEEGSGTEAGTGATVKMSSGGRFTRPTDVQVAEDGDAEYIIPVRKEDRAVPLLRQLLSELSPAARESLSLGDASLPLSGGIAAGMPASQVTWNNSNVSAPVTIQVHSSGVSAEQVGQKLYDTAERYLLRTLKGVFA